MLPQFTGGQAARPAKVISELLDSSLQSVPRAFRCRRWESYEREDVNSPLQFFHLKFKNRSVCLLCVWLAWRRNGNLSKCNVSIWASWFPLATVTAVGNALLWPNSQQTKAQKAKPMDLKARIINERDNFILVYKIVRRNVLKGLSMRRRSIRKQNNSSSSRL